MRINYFNICLGSHERDKEKRHEQKEASRETSLLLSIKIEV